MLEHYRMASRVLCATLAVPIAPSRNQIDLMLEQDDTSLEKQKRLTTLVGLTSPPTRAALIKDLVNMFCIKYPLVLI